MRSSYTLTGQGGEKNKVIKGVWVDGKQRREEKRNRTYSSTCSFEKKPLEPRRATGKNMHSHVQNMPQFHKGRQSPGALRFSYKN